MAFIYVVFSDFRYLRAQNPYQPPKNVPLLVDKLKESANLTTGFNGKSFTLQDKFDFLTLCGKEFNHTVPNSVLHEIQTISKLFEFFFFENLTKFWFDSILELKKLDFYLKNRFFPCRK